MLQHFRFQISNLHLADFSNDLQTLKMLPMFLNLRFWIPALYFGRVGRKVYHHDLRSVDVFFMSGKKSGGRAGKKVGRAGKKVRLNHFFSRSYP